MTMDIVIASVTMIPFSCAMEMTPWTLLSSVSHCFHSPVLWKCHHGHCYHHNHIASILLCYGNVTMDIAIITITLLPFTCLEEISPWTSLSPLSPGFPSPALGKYHNSHCYHQYRHDDSFYAYLDVSAWLFGHLLFWVSYTYVFCIFVFGPVHRSWACFTWRGALEIPGMEIKNGKVSWKVGAWGLQKGPSGGPGGNTPGGGQGVKPPEGF